MYLPTHKSFACSELDPSAAALLDSQADPFAARILTARPTSLAADVARTSSGITSLHAPVPVCYASGAPLERAAARVCREAGATVETNVLVRDLNAKMTAASRS